MKKEHVKIKLQSKVIDGEFVSPRHPDGIKNYLIDIDGTICDDIPNEEPEIDIDIKTKSNKTNSKTDRSKN
jgi:hypothetical protein